MLHSNNHKFTKFNFLKTLKLFLHSANVGAIFPPSVELLVSNPALVRGGRLDAVAVRCAEGIVLVRRVGLAWEGAKRDSAHFRARVCQVGHVDAALVVEA